MHSLAGSTCLHSVGTRALSSLVMHSTVSPASSLPRRRRDSTHRRAVQHTSKEAPTVDCVTATIVEEATPLGLPIEQEALFKEVLSQTVYVEKGTTEVNNAVPATALRHAEVVPDSPSFSLVRTPKPIDKRSQNRRLLAEVITHECPMQWHLGLSVDCGDCTSCTWNCDG